jgi:hypothetical protein
MQENSRERIGVGIKNWNWYLKEGVVDRCILVYAVGGVVLWLDVPRDSLELM